VEYLNIFFNDFLGRQVSIPQGAYVVVIHHSNLIKNIFICVLKMSKGLTGLVQVGTNPLTLLDLTFP